DVHCERFQTVVGFRKNFVVELNHKVRQESGNDKNRKHHSVQTDTACFHCGDFAVCGKSAEGHQCRNEYCHWYSEHNDPCKVEHHEFNDHGTAQSLSCELVHELHHELKNKQKHENDERADKRCEVGPQDMAEENHDAIYELSLLLAIL